MAFRVSWRRQGLRGSAGVERQRSLAPRLEPSPVEQDGDDDRGADDHGCRFGETLSSAIPLLSVPMMSNPTKVPNIVPEPPARLAPPITTTAMTLSRSAVPAVAESSLDVTIGPATAARNPAVT